MGRNIHEENRGMDRPPNMDRPPSMDRLPPQSAIERRPPPPHEMPCGPPDMGGPRGPNMGGPPGPMDRRPPHMDRGPPPNEMERRPGGPPMHGDERMQMHPDRPPPPMMNRPMDTRYNKKCNKNTLLFYCYII